MKKNKTKNKSKNKSKTKSKKIFDLKPKKAPEKFTVLQKAIFNVFLLAETPKFSLADLYVKQWNIVNYFIIGGIGVLFNFLIFYSFIGSLPWELTNILAIGTAMSWNWMNSVGFLCEHWGYTKNE